MAKYFDEQKWANVLTRQDWSLLLAEDFKLLTEKAKTSDEKTSKEIGEEVYGFIESGLASNKIFLGSEGLNWDEERKPIDTVVVHHTSNPASITPQKLSAMQLIRLYASYYASPNYRERDITGQAIYSNHFKEGRQVFYAYHWLVHMDGKTERLLNDGEIGWQAGNWDINRRSVAICLDNDFENSSPANHVLSAVAGIIKSHYPQVPAMNIKGHREINPRTICPGNDFLNIWKTKLTGLLQGNAQDF
ncbi:MAG TPA: peptidoglycan recognition family protein [Candidatus Paceibacterota bacterium]